MNCLLPPLWPLSISTDRPPPGEQGTSLDSPCKTENLEGLETREGGDGRALDNLL